MGQVNPTPDLLAVSSEFKKEATRSIISIVAFVTVYILLFALSLGLVAATIYGGIAIMMGMGSLLGLVFGAGLISVGVLVFVFLIKFLFSVNRADQRGTIRITEEDQPELVAFIHKIAEETGTLKPKKIFLSNDVNACVFYNSSFWSMFLPVKKNLQIGLGLVNSVNISEFKAVIAHEFGHFSQKSMKVGSYVYQVNKIIHDMLFNNNGFSNTLSTWGSIHWALGLFTSLTVWIIRGIQAILKEMYKVVNKSYMSLSRQMEFHADLVAASVSGSNNIISALKRIEFAGVCFQNTIDLYNEQWKENRVFQNLYADQRAVIKNLAALNEIPIENELPLITDQGMGFHFNRINYKDQWASHPELSEREAYLNGFDLAADTDHRSAWTLFTNTDSLQRTFTEQLYEGAENADKKDVASTADLEQIHITQINSFSLPEVYKGYYNNRQLEEFDLNVAGTAQPNETIEDILSEETSRLPMKIVAIERDIQVLAAIESRAIDVNSFDFDGVKHKRRAATEVKAILEQELENMKKLLLETDRKLYLHAYRNKALSEAEALRTRYNDHFTLIREAGEFFQELQNIMAPLQPLFAGETLDIERINRIIAQLKTDELRLKSLLKQWIARNAFDAQLTAQCEKFISADYMYFHDNSFFDAELIDLNQIVQESWRQTGVFLVKDMQDLLKLQAEIKPLAFASSNN